MKRKLFRAVLSTFFLLTLAGVQAQKQKTWQLSSPDKGNQIQVVFDGGIKWSVTHDGVRILEPSPLSLEGPGWDIYPGTAPVVKVKNRSVSDTIRTVAYKKAFVVNQFNEMELVCKGDHSIIFRAYDNGVAYRFVTRKKDEQVVMQENVNFKFEGDKTLYIPFTSDIRQGERYSCAFEEFYTRLPVSAIPTDTLGYLPMMVVVNDTLKAVLLEADVQDYPAMFIQQDGSGPNALKGVFAPYPAKEEAGAKYWINYAVTAREKYISRTSGTRSFPWRVIAISDRDADLLNNDLVQQLSEPSKITDPTWIKPGKVAWDWWNDWNITGVDFKAGINTETYKHYIDFASKNRLEYVILDEGWSDDWDLTKRNASIDLEAIIGYAKSKNVGIILWSTWYAITRDLEKYCAEFAAMGVKGFKVDFIDRNDQKAISSCYEIASVAARHHLMLDFHGMFAPQGLQRTWPNVVNFEGVRGMEYMKWSADDRVPEHAVRLPFLRMMAGPMDYTPGAFRNRTRKNAVPSNSLPQSLGTRCSQMAMYIVYEAPLQMLSDNPTIYSKEQACTDFIAAVPTFFDETRALDGQFGEYVVMARRKGQDWYVGALGNWTERDLVLDLSFLPSGKYQALIFRDGINATRDATDFMREERTITPGKYTFHLAPGGGFAIKLTPLN